MKPVTRDPGNEALRVLHSSRYGDVLLSGLKVKDGISEHYTVRCYFDAKSTSRFVSDTGVDKEKFSPSKKR
jgi:hypothetical protein